MRYSRLPSAPLIGDAIKPAICQPASLSSVSISSQALMPRRRVLDDAFDDMRGADFELRLDEAEEARVSRGGERNKAR